MWGEIADLPHTLEYVQVGPWRTRVLTVGEGEQTLVLLNGTSGHITLMRNSISPFGPPHISWSRCGYCAGAPGPISIA